jgi:hypothetical protein
MDRLSPDLHGEHVDPGNAAESEDGSAAMAMAIAMASHRRNILAALVSLSLALTYACVWISPTSMSFEGAECRLDEWTGCLGKSVALYLSRWFFSMQGLYTVP